jgi:16S rRNA (guanine966-N2)-methyltransferase
VCRSVLRIVGGVARGRRLVVPPRGTRPTSDRAREGLFNTLAAELDLDGARVLDLFAGSGALGLEALSRGASLVTFVEHDRVAADALRRNLGTVDLPGGAVLRCTVESYLVASGADEPYDVVLMDPPYAYEDTRLATVLSGLDDPRWLVGGGMLVVERAAKSPEPSWPSGVEALKQKRYGEAVLWYGRRR